MAAPFEVRRFRDGEAEALRRLRLISLQEAPAAFGTSLEQDGALPLDAWSRWIESNAPFGVFVGAEPRGLAGFSRETPALLAHRGSLRAMYVAPELRGTGAAASLVEAIVGHARALVEQVHLSVNADNLRAVRFYQRMQFVEYGREPAGLRHAGTDHDVLLMVRKLRDT